MLDSTELAVCFDCLVSLVGELTVEAPVEVCVVKVVEEEVCGGKGCCMCSGSGGGGGSVSCGGECGLCGECLLCGDCLLCGECF